MVQQVNNDIFITPLKRIPNEKGEILHALKSSEQSFSAFGEAYFSTIEQGCFKGWKKHSKMVLNLIVPVGSIRFYIVDEREELFVKTIVISKENYCRLTIPPGVWLGFEGIDKGLNILLNIASIEHDPAEAVTREKELYAHHFPQLQV